MPANTYGRQVVIPLTNKSGGSVAAGDVVVFDTTADESFTTTTTGQAELSVGVAQETIANNALGRVLVSGYAALINVPSSRTRGQYIETHTVAKQATGSATRRAGSFGQFAKTSATPSGWLWGATDQTATAGAAGALILLEQHTASASATLDYTAFISGTYDEYVFELLNVVPATNSVSLLVRAGTGGGPTYDTGANYDSSGWFVYPASSGITAGSAVGGTSISLITAAASAGNYGISGALRLINPASASLYKVLVGDIAYQHATVALIRAMVSGVYKSATAVTAIQFLMSSGNIASGTIRVYGIAK